MTKFELLYIITIDLSLTSEERSRFKTKLKDITFLSSKRFSDNCKLENNLSTEEIIWLEVLIRNKNIIQKADKCNTVAITD